MEKTGQVAEFASGNEMAAIAIRQIGYDLMGYYPITPSTQIAENLDRMKADGQTDLLMIAAEGEHSAAGICYGGAVGGGRVVNATSANGLLYALEQFPVQSGTRYPMVMNVACRTVSGPLSIKGDHSDIMYLLNAGWIILFAHSAQQVYDFNILALRLGEAVRLPVAVAYDGFFTSHQKRRCLRFEKDRTVRDFIGQKKEPYPFLDLEHPITVGAYMNEPDLMNNRYQLARAMEEAARLLPKLFDEYGALSGRRYGSFEGYCYEDADTLLVLLGSSYETAKEAADKLRSRGEKAGVLTLHAFRPFMEEAVFRALSGAKNVVIGDRQDSYGAGGGNLSLELRALMQKYGFQGKVKSFVYGLGGKDFFVEDAVAAFAWAKQEEAESKNDADENDTGKNDTDENDADENDADESRSFTACAGHKDFAYYGVRKGTDGGTKEPFFEPLSGEKTKIAATKVVTLESGMRKVEGGLLNATAAMPGRLAPGHGACPGCGIPVNLNLLLRAIEDPVVLLFQTGCGMIVTTPYPKTAFKVPYLHNLFQNGAATLSGLAEICYRKQEKGELPPGEIVFIMVSGDGGMDIGMGSALTTGLRGHRLLLFEYDNGGYMNTGYQLSYSTPKGAASATSHVGAFQYGKQYFHKDMPRLMAAANVPYVATVAESNPTDFIKKAAKAADYAKKEGCAYVKALSACPLNWNDNPGGERKVIEAAVNCCYFPLYEVEQGVTALSYDPEKTGKKIPVVEWLAMMGRTRHLQKQEYREVTESMQQEVDRRYRRLKEMAENPYL